MTILCAFANAWSLDAQDGSERVRVVKQVTLRPALPEEALRWDALMERHQPLRFNQCEGRGLRFVADCQGQ